MRWAGSRTSTTLFALLCAAATFAPNAWLSASVSRDEYRRPAVIPHPDENPYSVEKAELGRMLFFDPILSWARTRSCASCHNPSLSWGGGLPPAIGEGQHPMSMRAPTLRDVARRAPYMDNGSLATLEDVIALYDRGGIERPSRSELIAPLRLTQADKADLVAFLDTLTGEPHPVTVPVLPR